MRWNSAILPLAMTLAGCVGFETMSEPRGNGGPAAHPLDLAADLSGRERLTVNIDIEKALLQVAYLLRTRPLSFLVQ